MIRFLLFFIFISPNFLLAQAQIQGNSTMSFLDSARDYLDVACVYDPNLDANVAPSNGDIYRATYSNNATASADEANDIDPSITLSGGLLSATATPNIIVSGAGCVGPASISTSISGSTLSVILDAGEYDLGPGCSIAIEYEIYAPAGTAAGAYNISDEFGYKNSENGSFVTSPPSNTQQVQVNIGQSTVTKLPDNDTGAVGETINWAVEVANTGTGGLCDVVVIDTPSASVSLSTFPPTLINYIPAGDSEIFTVTGQIIGCEDIANNVGVFHANNPDNGINLPESTADSAITLDLETPLINFTDGPDDVATLAYDENTTICVDIENALIRGDAVDVVITPEPPSGFQITGTSSAGWTYDNGNGTFTYDDIVLGEGGTATATTLCVDVEPEPSCNVEDGGIIIWKSDYTDVCLNAYTLPVAVSQLPDTSGHPEVTITKTSNTDRRLDVGDSAEWIVDVTVTNPGGLDNMPFEVQDDLGNFMAIIGPPSQVDIGSTDCTSANCSDPFTWTLASNAQNLADGVTYQMVLPFELEDTQCNAGSFTTNNAVIDNLSFTVGDLTCDISENDGASILITNNPDNAATNQDFNVSTGGGTAGPNATIEAGLDNLDTIQSITEGEPVMFQATYNFGPSFGGDWSGVTYADDFSNIPDIQDRQEIIPDTLNVQISNCTDNAANGTTFLSSSDTILDGTGSDILEFNFDFVGSNLSLNNCNLVIEYYTTIKRPDPNTVWRTEFFTQRSVLSITGLNSVPSGACDNGGVTEYRQGAFIRVWRADPDVSIDLPDVINVCEPFEATIFVDHNGNPLVNEFSSPYNASNILLQLQEGSTNYILDTTQAPVEDGGFAGDITYAANGGTGTLFTYDNGLTSTQPGNELEADGTITVPMILTSAYSGGLPSLGVEMQYDDNQVQLPLSTPPRYYSETSSDAPALVNKASLVITVSPQSYVMTNTVFEYTIYVTNTGPSTAYGATVNDTIASGFTLNIGDTDAANSNPASGTNTRPTANVIALGGQDYQWELGDITPGGTVQIEVIADIDPARSCAEGTDGDITAQWGCGNLLLTDATGVNPTLIFPDGSLLVQHIASESAGELCTEDYVTLVVSNTGVSSVYDITVTEDLQTGNSGIDFATIPNFEYCVGALSLGACTWLPISNSPSSPSGSVSLDSTNISWLSGLVPQSEEDFANDQYSQVYIRFLVDINENSITANDPEILASAEGEISCGRVVTAPQSPYPYQIDAPKLVLDKKGRVGSTGNTSNTVFAGINDVVEWEIVIDNDGDADAQNVSINDILPPGSVGTAATVVGIPTATLPDFTIPDIPANSSVTYIIQQTLDAGCVNEQNTATVSYGCTGSSLLDINHPDYDDTEDTANLRMNTQVGSTTIDQAFTPLGGGRMQADIVITYNGGPVTISDLTDALPSGGYDIEGGTYLYGINAAATTLGTFTGPYQFTDLVGQSLEDNDVINIQFIITTTTHEDTVSDEFENDETITNGWDPQLPVEGDNIVSIQFDNSCGDPVVITGTEEFDPATPDLDIQVSPATDIATSGLSATYTFTITNNGDAGSIADNVTFTIDLDALSGWSGVVISSPSAGMSCTGSAPSYTCTLSNANSIAATQSVIVEFTGTAGTGGSLDILGTVTGGIEGTAQNYSLDTAKPKISGFVLDKVITSTNQADSTNPNVLIGEEITYTITAQWFGIPSPEEASNITIEDALPSGLGFISQAATFVPDSGSSGTVNPSSVPGVGASGTISYPIPNNGGGIFTATIVAVVLDNAAGTTLTNPADVDFTLFEEDYNNPSTYPELHDEVDVTVIRPTLEIEKLVRNVTAGGGFASTATGDAGDEFEYQITITNNGNAPLYDVVVQDALPNGMSISNANGGTVTSGPPDSIEFGVANIAALAQIGTGAGNAVIITYSATALIDVMPNQALDNSATAIGSSISDGDNVNNNATENEFILSDEAVATITINDVTFDKTIIDTSNPNTSGSNLGIGEQVEFEITMALPAGTISSLSIRDILPPNLLFIGGTAGNGVDGAAFGTNSTVGSQSLATSGNTQLDWTFSNIVTTGSSGTLTIRYIAQVMNIAANNNGLTFTNSAQFALGAGNFSTPVTVDMSVVEADVTLTKTVSPTTPVEAGDQMTFTITATNNSPDIPAYNIDLIDTLPAGLTYVDPPAPTGTPSAPIQNGNGVALGQTASQDIDIPAGGTVTITFYATIDDTVEPSEMITNTATIDWASVNDSADVLQGTMGSLGSNHGPRDNNSTLDSVNDNEASDAANITIANNYTISKALTDTSITEFNIGDIVNYTLTITLQEGTVENLMVTDTLPLGMAFVATSDNIVFDASAITLTSPTPTFSTPTLKWNFGTITNVGNGIGADNIITITYDAVVTDNITEFPVPTASPVTNVDQTNSAEIDYEDAGGNGNNVQAPDEPTITVQQPYLDIAKSTTSTEVGAGDTVTYQIVITNNGTGPAYDITIEDQLPEGINDATPTLTNNTSIALADITQVDTAGVPRIVQWQILNTIGLDPGNSIELEYEVTVDSDVVANSTITNSATIDEYFSHPEPTNQDRREYENDTPATATITTPTIDDINKAVDAATANIGETVTYTFTVPATTADIEVNSLVINDNAPTGIKFDTTSFALAGTNTATGTVTPTINNANFTVELDVLAPNEQLIFTVDGIVENIVGNQNGTVLTNSASLDFEENFNNPVIQSNDVTTTITEPVLTINKSFASASDTEIQEGTTITYDFSIDNIGTGSAHDIEILDIAHVWLQSPTLTGNPAVSISPTCVATSPSCVWTLSYSGGELLPSGSPITFSVTFTLTDYPGLDVVAFSNFTNSTTMTWTSALGVNPDERDGDDGTGGALDDYAASNGPVISLTGGVEFTKELYSTSDTDYAVGETVQYLLTFEGIRGTYLDLEFTDSLPSGMELVSVALENTITDNAQPVGGGTINPVTTGTTGNILIDLGDVEATAATGDMVVAVVVDVLISDTNLANGTTLTNNATIQASDPQFQSPATENVVITITAPELVISLYGQGLDDPTDVTPGVTDQFTIDIHHGAGSTSTAYQPEVEIELPPELCDGPPTPAISSVNIMPETGFSGRPAFSLTSPADYTAIFTPPSGGDCILTITFTSAQAYLDFDSANSIKETMQIIFDATLNPNTLFNATVDPIEADITTYYSAEISNISAATYGGTGTTPGTAPQAVGDDEADDHLLNVLASNITFSKRITSPIDVSAVVPGTVVTYRITVTNSGDADATGISISDVIPEEFAPNTLTGYSPATVSGTTITFSNGSTGTLTEDPAGGANGTGIFTISGITLPHIAPDNSFFFEYNVTLQESLPNGEDPTNAATISQDGFDPETVSTTLTIDSAPILEIEKSSSGPTPLEIGDTLEYTILVRNIGNEMLVNAAIFDSVPSGTTYVPDSMTVNGNQVLGATLPLSGGYQIDNTGTAGQLEVQAAGGTDVIVTFEVTINSGLAEGAPIHNTATVSGNPESTPSDNPMSEDDSVSDVIGNKPLIEAIKSVVSSPDPADIGSTLTYTIEISNNGAVDATNVVFTDAIPANTTYVASSIIYDGNAQTDASDSPIDESEFDGSNVIVNIGTLAVDQTVTITFQVTIDSPLPAVGYIYNQGSVASDGLPDKPTNPVITPTGTDPILFLTKNVVDVNGGTVMPGDVIEYNLVITNNGNGDATNVVINDPGPTSSLLDAGFESFAFNNVTTAPLAFGANWLVGNLGAGESASYTYAVKISGSATDGDTIINQATFNYDGSACSNTSGDGVPATGSCISDSVLDDGEESGNDASNANDDDETLIQIGGAPGIAAISGVVWRDEDHDRLPGSSEPKLEGWTVELLNGGVSTGNTAITDINGEYSIVGLLPGPDYELLFYPPGSTIPWGRPVSAEGTINGPRIDDLNLPSGQIIPNQNLPVDPTGVVYNSITRQPVAGATVQFYDASGTTLLGADCIPAEQQGQITGADGWYQMDVINGCPNLGSDFVIIVTPPPGYLPIFPSGILPDISGTLTLGTGNTVNAIVGNNQEPQTSDPTTYHLTINIPSDPAGFQVMVNNHIPIDPILEGAIIVRKTTPKPEAARGDLVPYTITVMNTLDVTIPNVMITDLLPPGFKYVDGSATVNGAAYEPDINGREMEWTGFDVDPAPAEIVIKFLAIIGSGVSDGEYINQAYASDGFSGTVISNIAEAVVRIIPDPIFDCSEIIGKVFDDKNANGYHDKGEPGIPSARMFNTYGLKIITDAYGRFHVPCAMVPNEMRGSNYTLKLDTRSLPTGYKVTTENPRAVRLTRGKATKLNFGARLMNVIKIVMLDKTFEDEKQMAAMFKEVEKRMVKGPALISILYSSHYHSVYQRHERILKMIDEIKEIHSKLPREQKHELLFEHEIRTIKKSKKVAK